MEQAKEEAVKDQAYWYRGIVIRDKTRVGDIGYVDNLIIRSEGEMPPANCWTWGLYFGHTPSIPR